MGIEEIHSALIDDLVRERGLVMLIGGPDTGKTSLAKRLLNEALRAGRRPALVDADIGHSSVGPPACVGLKWIHGPEDLDRLNHADDLRFVGAVSPDGAVLQSVVATASLVEEARTESDLVVLDTSGTVSGVIGQTLKYHKAELCRPEMIVALQRGGEMEPVVDMLRRFFNARVELIGVDPSVAPISIEERRAERAKKFEEAFAPPRQRWRVQPTVFAPTLPEGLDLSRLHHMLVGLHDTSGRCRGLGVLSYEDDGLLVVANRGEEMRGLRLGQLRLHPDTFDTESIRLREVMFGL
ncbi:MAG: Clp1/GlmU family protein [Acidimicrobiia bacterium]|nr:Clp1/GlmU family protein [Acidimicrobiia bacterium]